MRTVTSHDTATRDYAFREPLTDVQTTYNVTAPNSLRDALAALRLQRIAEVQTEIRNLVNSGCARRDSQPCADVATQPDTAIWLALTGCNIRRR